MRQMRQLARVPSDVSPMPKRQNWYALESVFCCTPRCPQSECDKLCSTLYVGYEPRRLFNVVEFLMNDKDDSGSVSVEEAMQILYLRFGKGLLDSVGSLPRSRTLSLLFPGNRHVCLSFSPAPPGKQKVHPMNPMFDRVALLNTAPSIHYCMSCPRSPTRSNLRRFSAHPTQTARKTFL